MKAAVLVCALIIATANACVAQAKPTKVDTTYGSCSPNMSYNSGNVTIKCTGLDPAVAAEISEIVKQLSLLNKKTATEKNQQFMIKMLKDMEISLKRAIAKPTIQDVSAPQGIAIGGNNYGNPIVNNYGPPKYVMTDDQTKIITDAMKPYAGAQGKIACVGTHQDVYDYCNKLSRALDASGVNAPVERDMMSDAAPGLSVSYTNSNYQVVNGLGLALQRAKLTNGPLDGTKIQNPQDSFTIWITPME